MKTTTTHSFELTYAELLKILKAYILQKSPSSSNIITSDNKKMSLNIDYANIPSGSKISIHIEEDS